MDIKGRLIQDNKTFPQKDLKIVIEAVKILWRETFYPESFSN